MARTKKNIFDDDVPSLYPSSNAEGISDNSVLQVKPQQPRGSEVFQRGSTKRTGKLSNVEIHKHDGKDLPKQEMRDLNGFIEVVTAVPTGVPRNFWEQIKIYDNAGTPTLYVYDYVAQTWRTFT